MIFMARKSGSTNASDSVFFFGGQKMDESDLIYKYFDRDFKSVKRSLFVFFVAPSH